MINYIKGEIIKKGIDYLVIEANNIGYYVNTSLNTLKKIVERETYTIYIYMHIREDILALYGFSENEELEMFKKLISVNGVGPKAGLAVLSMYDINSLKVYLIRGDDNAISKVPGVGKKTASKIILDLKDKVGSIDNISVGVEIDEIGMPNIETNKIDDLVSVLMTLGFSQIEARKALENIDILSKTEDQIIKEALKNINR